jgi:hypothetical protein
VLLIAKAPSKTYVRDSLLAAERGHKLDAERPSFRHEAGDRCHQVLPQKSG